MTSNRWSPGTKVCLPRPYLTTFRLVASRDVYNHEVFQLSKEEGFAGEASLPVELHDENITFTKPKVLDVGGLQECGAIATSQQASRQVPTSVCNWEKAEFVTINHIWLVIYTIFLNEPDLKLFRLELKGAGGELIAEDLRLSMVAMTVDKSPVILRNAFWQGCASPLGSNPIWTPSAQKAVPHLNYVTTTTATVHRTHPLRPPKPTPGTVVYSRYIPSLEKTFSLIVLDYQEPTHVEFFHQAKKTSATTSHPELYGDSLEESYEFLRRQSEDAHNIGLLGQFDYTLFGYFEVFWAKEDPLGMASDAGDFDRGLSGSVGYSAFKSQRWLQACWSSLLHYVFLDEHRTENVIGEATWGHEVLGDMALEFLDNEVVELPHQRINLTKCSRGLFFLLCPFDGMTKSTALQVSSRL